MWFYSLQWADNTVPGPKTQLFCCCELYHTSSGFLDQACTDRDHWGEMDTNGPVLLSAQVNALTQNLNYSHLVLTSVSHDLITSGQPRQMKVTPGLQLWILFQWPKNCLDPFYICNLVRLGQRIKIFSWFDLTRWLHIVMGVIRLLIHDIITCMSAIVYLFDH